MNKGVLIPSVIVIAVIAIGAIVFTKNPAPNGTQIATPSTEPGIMAVLHKSPTCGCCGVYGSYMKKIGYNMQTSNMDNMEEIKVSLGVPQELWSCHTVEVGGYVAEGHIPEEAIRKMLDEKPDIKGIGMAGMPSGSPGMPGPKSGDFLIYEILHDGSKGGVYVTL